MILTWNDGSERLPHPCQLKTIWQRLMISACATRRQLVYVHFHEHIRLSFVDRRYRFFFHDDVLLVARGKRVDFRASHFLFPHSVHRGCGAWGRGTVWRQAAVAFGICRRFRLVTASAEGVALVFLEFDLFVDFSVSKKKKQIEIIRNIKFL